MDPRVTPTNRSRRRPVTPLRPPPGPDGPPPRGAARGEWCSTTTACWLGGGGVTISAARRVPFGSLAGRPEPTPCRARVDRWGFGRGGRWRRRRPAAHGQVVASATWWAGGWLGWVLLPRHWQWWGSFLVCSSLAAWDVLVVSSAAPALVSVFRSRDVSVWQRRSWCDRHVPVTSGRYRPLTAAVVATVQRISGVPRRHPCDVSARHGWCGAGSA